MIALGYLLGAAWNSVLAVYEAIVGRSDCRKDKRKATEVKK